MQQGVLRTFDLNPDGVRIKICWDKMVINSSIFIPCINTQEATRQVKKIVLSKNWEVEINVRIEGEKLGLRVWRIM